MEMFFIYNFWRCLYRCTQLSKLIKLNISVYFIGFTLQFHQKSMEESFWKTKFTPQILSENSQTLHQLSELFSLIQVHSLR